MAKYAQGFERKNSDTKNLIILFSIIIGVVILAIAGVLIYNSVHKETVYSYDSVSEEYIIPNDDLGTESGCYYQSIITGEKGNSKVLYWNDETDYYVYFYSESDSQSTIKTILDYYEEKGDDAKLYLLSVPSTTTYLKASLDIESTPSSGMFLVIKDHEVTDIYSSFDSEYLEK